LSDLKRKIFFSSPNLRTFFVICFFLSFFFRLISTKGAVHVGERGGKSSRGRRKEEKEGGRECGVREADEAET